MEPSFAIIGASKSATTSLYDYITQHPEVQAAQFKEINYYSLNYHKGLKWYLSFFPLKKNNCITGEGSVTYLDEPAVPQRIKDTLPSMKFIVSLRNPIDRAYSEYNHVKRRGFESLSFEESFTKEERQHDIKKNIYQYFERGKYYYHLKKWFEVFTREQFFIFEYEKLQGPQKTLDNIFLFLGLKKHRISDLNRRLVGRYEPMPADFRSRLKQYYKPYNEKLFELLGERFDW